MAKDENFCKCSQQSLPVKGKHYDKQDNIKKEPESEKQSPKDMIRALQGIFCKGRYQSWVLSQKTTPVKHSKKSRSDHE